MEKRFAARTGLWHGQGVARLAPNTRPIPDPFTMPSLPCIADKETFGTVTAARQMRQFESARASQGAPSNSASAQPLVFLSFEVASGYPARRQSFANGGLGPVTLTLPDLADPAYRGESASLLRQMRFQYTGWLRAQKLLPMSNLKVGNNDLIIVSGAGTPTSAIRAAQVQLKYLWDKSDYQLQTNR